MLWRRTKAHKEESALDAVLLWVPLEEGAVNGGWQVIVPDGAVQSKKGDFVVDAECAGIVVAAFQEQGVDLVIDNDHRTLGGEYATPDGLAPAFGWIKALKYEPGRGILGLVEWNGDGLDLVERQQYRYFSPTVAVRRVDRRIIGLHSVALVNKPAIRRMEPIRIAASEQLGSWLRDMEVIAMAEPGGTDPSQGNDGNGGEGGNGGAEAMSDEKLFLAIKEKLGLSEEATPEEVLAAIDTLAGAATEPNKAGDGKGAANAEGGEVDVRGMVKQELAAFRQEQQAETDKRRCEARVEQLVAKGELLERDREFALTLSEEQIKHYLGTGQAKGRPPAGKTEPPSMVGGRDRQPVIVQACREYDADSGAQAVASKKAFVNQVLRDEGLNALTKKEDEEYSLLTA